MADYRFTQNRQSGPQVYNYGRDTLINVDTQNQQMYYNPNTATYQSINQPVIQTIQHVQPVRPTTPIVVNPQRTSQVAVNPQRTSQVQIHKGSRAEVVSTDKRFTNYHANEYKYNLFSLIDQPWNRCIQIGKCGSCPGNQCITKQARRGVWNLN